jgi:hypothetical protein
MSTRCAAASAALAVVMPLLSPGSHRPLTKARCVPGRVETHGAPTRSHTRFCDDGTRVRSARAPAVVANSRRRRGQLPSRRLPLVQGKTVRRFAGGQGVDETLPSKPGAGRSRAERDEMSHVATYESRTQPYFSRPARSEAKAQVRQIGTAIAIYVGVPCRCPGRHRRRKEGRYGARYRQDEVDSGRARRVACGSSGSDPP